MSQLKHQIASETQQHTFIGEICESPVHEADLNFTTTSISYPQPAAAGSGNSTLPSYLRLQPSPEARTSRSASPPQISRDHTKDPFNFSPGELNRTTPAIGTKQSLPDSMLHRMAPQRASSSSIVLPGSANSSEASQRRHKARKSFAIAEFFTGSSEVVSAFHAPSKRNEADTSSAKASYTRRPSYTRSTGSSLSSAASSLFTRGRNLTSKSPLQKNSRPTAKDDPEGFGFENDDEFLDLRIERELFPDARGDFDGVSGTPEEAFDALLANAERLFMRMQIAYQAKHEAMLTLKATRRDDTEELEEAKERNEHLKAQLDTLGSEIREKDNELQHMSERLHLEKELRKADSDKRVRSVRIVRADEGNGFRTESITSAASSVHSSQADSADTGGIWSRPQSRSSGSVSSMPDEVEISNFSPGEFGGGLREENLRLKARIAELEDTVEGCLGLVHDL